MRLVIAYACMYDDCMIDLVYDIVVIYTAGKFWWIHGCMYDI